MSGKASTQRPIGCHCLTASRISTTSDILYNNGTYVSQLAGHPSVSAPPRAGVCDRAENRSTQARRFLWLCCSPGSIHVVLEFVVTCRSHMSHSNALFFVISTAGPRSLHDASFTCKCALAAPSYRPKHAYLRVHVFRVTLRSLRCAFLPSTCRQRSCLCLLLAPTCIVVCPVPFAFATHLRNCSLFTSPVFMATLGSVPLRRLVVFSYRRSSRPGGLP